MTKRLKNVQKNRRNSELHKSLLLQERIDINSIISSTTTITSSDSNVTATSQSEEQANLTLVDKYLALSDVSDSEQDLKELTATPLLKSWAEDMRFFDNFSDLADINSISEDESMTSVIPVKDPVSFSRIMQQVVPPMSSLEMRSDLKFSSQIDLIKPSPKESEEKFVLESQQSEDSDYKIQSQRLEETHKIIIDIEKEQTTDILEKFFELNSSKIDAMVVDKTDLEALAKERETEKLRQQTLIFINDLVHKVVETAEFVSEELILRQSLDKRKLLAELFNLYRKSEEEQCISKLLNLKVVNYYKRRNMYRPILKENAKTLPQQKETYFNAIRRLDELLAKKRNVEDTLASTITKLDNELKRAKQQTENKISIFEDVIKKNLCSEKRLQLNMLVENLLKTMAKYRQEVSDVRYQVIIKQETYAQLLNKVSRLEDLGDGITVKYYHQIQIENQSLNKKIEERNADLKKLYQRFHKNFHFMAHLKEKQSILKATTAKKSSAYEKLKSEWNSLRKYVFQLKLKSSQTRKEIKELNMQDSLIDKPALMYDYDQTVKYLREQSEIVKSLRATLETIEQRICKLEKQLTRDNNSLYINK